MSDKPKCAWCKIDTEEQISVKSDELPLDESKHSYPIYRCPTCNGLRDSGQEHIRINNMRQIYEGCVSLMQSVIGVLEECMRDAEITGEELADFLGVDPNENGGVEFSISNSEIVQNLFLSHTWNSGGTSTGILEEKLGIKHGYVDFVIGEREGGIE